MPLNPRFLPGPWIHRSGLSSPLPLNTRMLDFHQSGKGALPTGLFTHGLAPDPFIPRRQFSGNGVDYHMPRARLLWTTLECPTIDDLDSMPYFGHHPDAQLHSSPMTFTQRPTLPLPASMPQPTATSKQHHSNEKIISILIPSKTIFFCIFIKFPENCKFSRHFCVSIKNFINTGCYAKPDNISCHNCRKYLQF